MFQPSEKILEKYASVLIHFALGGGIGVQKGQSVLLQVPECAKPMLVALRRAVMKAEAHAIVQLIPDDMTREFFEMGNQEQISYFPEKYMKGIVDSMDHSVYILAETNKQEL